MHEDVIYARGCPVWAKKVVLKNKDGTKTEVIIDGGIKPELLR